jgi:hypothetical protein
LSLDAEMAAKQKSLACSSKIIKKIFASTGLIFLEIVEN